MGGGFEPVNKFGFLNTFLLLNLHKMGRPRETIQDCKEVSKSNLWKDYFACLLKVIFSNGM